MRTPYSYEHSNMDSFRTVKIKGSLDSYLWSLWLTTGCPGHNSDILSRDWILEFRPRLRFWSMRLHNPPETYCKKIQLGPFSLTWFADEYDTK